MLYVIEHGDEYLYHLSMVDGKVTYTSNIDHAMTFADLIGAKTYLLMLDARCIKSQHKIKEVK